MTCFGEVKMSNANSIPQLTPREIREYFIRADETARRRFPRILHKSGDYLNKTFNFILSDSYMRPHLHPSQEKVERMYLIKGSFALVLFDDQGKISDTAVLQKDGCEQIDVPAFTWHTYVMLTDKVLIYETMEGVYHPDTWKEMASWAPAEDTTDAIVYLSYLKANVE